MSDKIEYVTQPSYFNNLHTTIPSEFMCHDESFELVKIYDDGNDYYNRTYGLIK